MYTYVCIYVCLYACTVHMLFNWVCAGQLVKKYVIKFRVSKRESVICDKCQLKNLITLSSFFTHNLNFYYNILFTRMLIAYTCQGCK